MGGCDPAIRRQALDRPLLVSTFAEVRRATPHRSLDVSKPWRLRLRCDHGSSVGDECPVLPTLPVAHGLAIMVAWDTARAATILLRAGSAA